jgi:N-formylglutamate amidohydrolase
MIVARSGGAMSTPTEPPFLIEPGDAPILAAAVHSGHSTRAEIAPLLQLDAAQRLREDDPFTGDMARAVAQAAGGTLILGCRSRFEVDLNRPREAAIYLRAEDAWGLHVWREKPDEAVLARTLAQYDAFYDAVRRVLQTATQRYGRVVVYDLHSYNHRRDGAGAAAANARENPEVNIGTGTLRDRAQWAPVIERLRDDLSCFDFCGRALDVRENVKFRGGYFPRWMHETFPDSVCAISLEFKKFWMDEWSGRPDRRQLAAIEGALQSTVPGVLRELKNHRDSRYGQPLR